MCAGDRKYTPSHFVPGLEPDPLEEEKELQIASIKRSVDTAMLMLGKQGKLTPETIAEKRSALIEQLTKDGIENPEEIWDSLGYGKLKKNK